MKFATELMNKVETKEVVLATLDGSEKQIKWATDIRTKMLALVSDLDDGGYDLKGTDERVEKLKARMIKRTEQVMNYLINCTSSK